MHYQYPAATADVAVLALEKKQVKILLIQRKNPPFQGSWALPGGFMDDGETFLQAAVRELEEETHLKHLPLLPLGMFDKVDRDPRGRTFSMVYWTITNAPQNASAGSDAGALAWFSLAELPPLAFDHDEIVLSLKKQMQIFYHSALPLLQAAPELKAKQLTKILEILNTNFLEKTLPARKRLL